MNIDQRKIELRTQVISLGKEVAESHSTTQFPEWIHFKIGISSLEGMPFENEYWQNRMKPSVEKPIS